MKGEKAEDGNSGCVCVAEQPADEGTNTGTGEGRRSIFTRKSTLVLSFESRAGLLCVCLQPLLTLQGRAQKHNQ